MSKVTFNVRIKTIKVVHIVAELGIQRKAQYQNVGGIPTIKTSSYQRMRARSHLEPISPFRLMVVEG